MKRFHVLIPLSSVIALVGCGRHEEPASKAESALPAVAVQLAAARAETLPEVTEITGTVRPARRAQIAAKVMGTIEEMPVTLGQRVKSGDLLVKVSAGEIVARVAQAQSQLNAARRDLERERALLEKGASTSDMVRGLEDRFAAAQAMVREAETMQGYATITAPFEGVVARKLANAGDLASPGMPLLEVEGTDDFQVEAGVPDSLAAQLKPGAEIHVHVPGLDTTFSGKLTELSSAADPAAHTVLAKISVPSEIAVRSGQFVRVQVTGKNVPSLTVPVGAVSTVGQMQRVFVAGENNRAILRLVKTGATRGDRVEILAGLDRDERVVVGAPAGLREGQPLEVLQ